MGVPGNANALLLRSAAAAGGYQVSRSLRFNSSDSVFLSRTPASAGNRKTWTFSCWLKRGLLGSSFQTIIGAGTGGNAEASIRFNSDDALEFYAWTGGYNARLYTTQVFRDVSAWYHLVAVFDTPNATADQRIRLYVNGIEITTFSSRTNPTQNYDGYFNNSISHTIGDAVSGASPRFFNGYLADIHFIDGQALTPSSFTEVSATTGQLIPNAYTGSFGTNGFWLKFSDNSGTTSTTLGKDSAGSNNWTPNNFSVAAGAGNDSLVDTPTSYGTDTGAGGEVRGNYCTWNPLDKNANISSANGNLDASAAANVNGAIRGTIGVSSGKWYWEYLINNTSPAVGIATAAATLADFPGIDANGYGYTAGAQKWNNNSGSSYGATYTTNDIIGVALDLDAGTLVFYKNGVSQGTAYSGLPARTYFPAGGRFGGTFNVTLNAGQRAFAHPAPSGFKALCDTNLPSPVVAKPNTVMDVKLYTGNGGTQTISGLGFSPDVVWLKSRSGAFNHALFDTVRSAGYQINPNLTDAETLDTTKLSAFTSDGFTLGSQSGVNGSGSTFVAWTWDAGTSTVTNTQGSITSSVRANPSAGFSVVTYVGTGGTGGTVGHGLGVAPSLIIAKSRSAARDWAVYHKDLTKDKYLNLNATTAASTTTSVWGSAEPTSTVFGVYAWSTAQNNASGENMVAYCFAPVTGYSSMGSYVGNGSADGPFVYTGHRTRFLLYKRSDSTASWNILDTARDSYNLANTYLAPNLSGAEVSGGSADCFDFLSNGFKIRGSGTGTNASGGTYVFASFAESPFQYARAR